MKAATFAYMATSAERTETKLRPPYCDPLRLSDCEPGPSGVCDGPAALDESCRS